MLLKLDFLGNPDRRTGTGTLLPFLTLVGRLVRFSLLSGLPFSWVQMRSIASNKIRSKRMSFGVMPSLFILYWSCHGSGHICSTRAPSSASMNRTFLGLVLAFACGVVEARHLSNVGIELLYSTYKLTYIDVLWLLKYI
jgi:hypothetical protein